MGEIHLLETLKKDDWLLLNKQQSCWYHSWVNERMAEHHGSVLNFVRIWVKIYTFLVLGWFHWVLNKAFWSCPVMSGQRALTLPICACKTVQPSPSSSIQHGVTAPDSLLPFSRASLGKKDRTWSSLLARNQVMELLAGLTVLMTLSHTKFL